MRHPHVLLLCALFIAPVSAREPDRPAPVLREPALALDHVRSLDSSTAQLIEVGYRRSPTLRRLIHRLEVLDIVVYVEHRILRAGDVGGYLTVLENPTIPMVRVALNRHVATPLRIGLLGHELQHAVEVAEGRVRNRGELQRLYDTIGFEGRVERSYESQAAREVELAVIREIRRPDARPS